MLNSSDISRIATKAAGIGVAVVLFASVAVADTFHVQPASFSLSARQPTATFKINNPGTEEMIVRMHVMDWSQDNGRDRLSPSRKLIVTPEQVIVRPGRSQTVRMGVRLSAPRWEEEAYRIVLSEVKRPPDVGVSSPAPSESGPRAMRRSSLPVFVRPPGDSYPRLLWRIQRNGNGTVKLHVSNHGAAHVQLKSASIRGPDGQTMRKDHMEAYILPGKGRSWLLAGDVSAGLWRLTADTSVGPMEAELQLDSDSSAGIASTIGR